MTHSLETFTWFALPRPEVFAFFADAANLQRITPPELRFSITSELPIEMKEGALIEYRLRLFGIRFGWRTRISVWEPHQRFVDEQLRGPYRLWEHTHEFREIEGGTEMLDVVRYELPFAPFGEVARPLVRRELTRIFDYRKSAIREILGADAER